MKIIQENKSSSLPIACVLYSKANYEGEEQALPIGCYCPAQLDLPQIASANVPEGTIISFSTIDGQTVSLTCDASNLELPAISSIAISQCLYIKKLDNSVSLTVPGKYPASQILEGNCSVLVPDGLALLFYNPGSEELLLRENTEFPVESIPDRFAYALVLPSFASLQNNISIPDKESYYRKAAFSEEELPDFILDSVSGGECAADSTGAGACGENACAANSAGAGACGANACAAATCGADTCAANACPAAVCGANVCGANTCAGDVCAVNLIPAIPLL